MHVDLHWLDVPERVKFKLVSMVPSSQGSRYLMDYCIPISDLPGVITSLCRHNCLELTE